MPIKQYELDDRVRINKDLLDSVKADNPGRGEAAQFVSACVDYFLKSGRNPYYELREDRNRAREEKEQFRDVILKEIDELKAMVINQSNPEIVDASNIDQENEPKREEARLKLLLANVFFNQSKIDSVTSILGKFLDSEDVISEDKVQNLYKNRSEEELKALLDKYKNLI